MHQTKLDNNPVATRMFPGKKRMHVDIDRKIRRNKGKENDGHEDGRIIRKRTPLILPQEQKPLKPAVYA